MVVMNLLRLIMPLSGAFLLSCGMVAIKPIVTVPDYQVCESVKDVSFSITQIEKNVKRYNPVESPVILLNTNWGNPLKTLKVFKYYENGAMKYLLLFHVRERYGEDISNCNKMEIVSGKDRTQTDIVQDASVFIADISDLYFYTFLTEPFFKKMIKSPEFKFVIASYEFQMNSECMPLLAL